MEETTHERGYTMKRLMIGFLALVFAFVLLAAELIGTCCAGETDPDT